MKTSIYSEKKNLHIFSKHIFVYKSKLLFSHNKRTVVGTLTTTIIRASVAPVGRVLSVLRGQVRSLPSLVLPVVVYLVIVLVPFSPADQPQALAIPVQRLGLGLLRFEVFAALEMLLEDRGDTVNLGHC